VEYLKLNHLKTPFLLRGVFKILLSFFGWGGRIFSTVFLVFIYFLWEIFLGLKGLL